MIRLLVCDAFSCGHDLYDFCIELACGGICFFSQTVNRFSICPLLMFCLGTSNRSHFFVRVYMDATVCKPWIDIENDFWSIYIFTALAFCRKQNWKKKEIFLRQKWNMVSLGLINKYGKYMKFSVLFSSTMK